MTTATIAPLSVSAPAIPADSTSRNSARWLALGAVAGSVARWACAALLALTPVGLVVAGIFNLESALLHLTGALLALASPVLSFLLAGLCCAECPAGGGSPTACCLPVR
jgi:hypothetical protein